MAGDRVDAVAVPKGDRARKLHKAFLRYHDPANWPLLREALKEMGRADLIGNGKKQLIPAWQPAGTGGQPPKTGQIQKPIASPRSNQGSPRPPGKPTAPRRGTLARKA